MGRRQWLGQFGPGFAWLLLICSVGGAASGQVPAAVRESRVVTLDVPAPALEGNLLGTPTVQRAAVYLPPGYDSLSRRYPVIYLLHGIFDSHRTWVEHFGVPGILDRLIDRAEIPSVIVVMPDGGNRLGGGFYRNSATSGNWGSYIAADLVSFVDEHFRTEADPRRRAVVGHSMGGYGAIELTMSFEVFSVAWAMSPCCLAPVEDLGLGNESWKTLFAIRTREEIDDAIARRDFYTVVSLAVLTAFRPDPSNPPFFVDFPYEIRRGEMVLDQEEYAAYLEEFPLYRLQVKREALSSLRGLAIDYGTGDQFLHIPEASRELSYRLAELRIPHRFEVYAGDHREQVSERLESVVFPWVMQQLAVVHHE